MSDLTIAEVQTFVMQFRTPATRLVVVKVVTSEPGLYGLGCATFTQRHRAVEAALKHHIGPAVVGRDPRQIEDIWQGLMVSGYWRNGPVLNNAISGIDMALWDIKGKLAGMPCYDLWGGKCRPGALAYAHADGPTPRDVADRARAFMAQGYKVIRCQLGGYAGTRARREDVAGAGFPGVRYDPVEKLRQVPALFGFLRSELGDEVGLLYDVHERLAPIAAIQLAKRLEPCHLFFLEDILAPEDEEWLTMLRAQCATPIAMGELFNHPHEMTPFIARRLFDFVRVHISQIGGITPAIKLAHLCGAFGVRTAWHCPGDVSPVGAAANVHLDLAMHNFGVQEWGGRSDEECAAFPGMPDVREGMLTVSGRPGLGVEFDEKLAAQFPADDVELDWTQARLPDGTIARP